MTLDLRTINGIYGNLNIDKMKNKTLIVVACSEDKNPYEKTKNFYDKNVDFDIEICSHKVKDTERNFKKYQDAYIKNPDYKYYMLAHDDLFDFQPHWLSTMIETLNFIPARVPTGFNEPVGMVCHQLFSDSGSYHGNRWIDPKDRPPHLRHEISPKTKANTDDEIYGGNKATKKLVMAALTHYFKDKARLVDLIGADQGVFHNHVLKEMQEYGGIPIPCEIAKLPEVKESGLSRVLENNRTAGPNNERIFSGFVNSMGYRAKDCRVNGMLPYTHQFLSSNPNPQQ